MNSSELLPIDPLNALNIIAFLQALAQLDSLPEPLLPAIKQVGGALAKGQTNVGADLEEIAEQDATLNQFYQAEYNKLVAEYDSQNREMPGRRTDQVRLDPKPPYLGNVAAEILSQDNPIAGAQDNINAITSADPYLDPRALIELNRPA